MMVNLNMEKQTDENTTVDQLKRAVKKFSEERDWLKYHTPKDLAISITLEASELLEHFQWLNEEETNDKLKNKVVLAEIKSELADVINYAFAFSNRLGLDVTDALKNKIEENEAKYPVEKIKGNYKKYYKIQE